MSTADGRPVVVVAVHDGTDAARLCAQVEALLRLDRGVRLEVRGTALSALDAVTRARLAARQLGREIEVRSNSQLDGLAELCGLVVQVGGQPEALEEGGVEEVVHVRDASA